MRGSLSFLTVVSACLPLVRGANFTLVDDWSGQNFFNGWDFYNHYDNTTNGDVQFVDQATATSAHLAFINAAGNAILKVDNTSLVPDQQKRNSVRIGTQKSYGPGSIWIFDALHLPYGCSVWPSFWTTGIDWPNQGEIDIVEGVNTMTFNQMALHTGIQCNHDSSVSQTGKTAVSNCTQSPGAAGCTVAEQTPNSFGESFATAGGGVWATQFDNSGISIWFWNRKSVPASITTATDSIDISSWGTPSAAYASSGCDISKAFGPQQLVLDITLCGDWAGGTYQQSCGGDGSPNYCYANNVINSGSPGYANAYFEIASIRTFAANSSVVSSGSASSAASSGAAASNAGTHSTGSASPSATGGSKGAGVSTVALTYVTALVGVGSLLVASLVPMLL